MLAIGMITCDRPDVDVHDAIGNLRAGGFRELLHLFCEPGTPPVRPLPKVVVHQNPVRRGVLGNWAYCLQWLVEHTSAAYLMVCEDDVLYAKGARLSWEMDLDRLGPVGYWSFYTPRRDAQLAGESLGWLERNRGRDTWGTLAMCFPRTSAERLLAYQPLHQEDQLRGHTDYIVASCFLEAKVPCYYHHPSLADHVGRVSTVGHNWSDECLGLGFDPEFQPGLGPMPAVSLRTESADLSSGGEVADSAPALPEHRCARPRRTAVVTVYQNNIPPEVVSLQAEVINRFLPPGCEFEPREVGHHALGLDEYFRELRHEAYLVLDIDSIPLAEWVIPWFLENALAGILVGAAQRANQFANGEHIYAGPGAVAFSRDIFEQLGHLSFKATDHGDVGEELTFEAERLGIPVSLLWPTHVFTDKWPLRGGRRFGHGTTYGGAVFHAYEISKGHTVPMFLAKCREVLGRRVDDHQFALLADATSGEFKSPQRPDEPQARFHEEWYPEPELAPLAALAKSIKGKPGLVLEIGCWEGRSTSTIANACYPETLTAVDTWQGNVSEDSQHVSVRLARERDVFGTCRDNLRVLTRGNVILQRVDAFSFLQRCDQPIRFCHLDAANDYPFVREAISLLLPRLAVGGILCGHNFEIAHAGRGDLQGGIERAVRELLPGFTRTGSVWSYVRPGS